MRKILVTGGAGNVGSALTAVLVQNPENFVVVVDNLTTGSISKLPVTKHNNLLFIKADTNVYHDISAVMLAHRFEFVFHYAALVGVKRTLDNPIRVLNDIEGIKHVLSLSKNTGVRRVFYSSSSEVYGEPVEFPQNEHTTPLNSKLPYAIVKNLGEAFLRSYEKEYGLNYTIFRFFNTYGPNQSTDFVLARFVDSAMKGEDITIYGDGMQTRTFCYIQDNIEATIKTMEADLFVNDVINVGNDIETTVLELAQKVIYITNSTSKIVFLPPLKEGDMSRRKPDNSKMLAVLARPLTSLEDGIRKTIEYRNFS